jgi:hypothetical protein
MDDANIIDQQQNLKVLGKTKFARLVFQSPEKTFRSRFQFSPIEAQNVIF